MKATGKSVRFTENIRAYLKEKFVDGEETGRKANASGVARQIKTLRTATRKKIFAQDEWIAEKKDLCKSYWKPKRKIGVATQFFRDN